MLVTSPLRMVTKLCRLLFRSPVSIQSLPWQQSSAFPAIEKILTFNEVFQSLLLERVKLTARHMAWAMQRDKIPSNVLLFRVIRVMQYTLLGNGVSRADSSVWTSEKGRTVLLLVHLRTPSAPFSFSFFNSFPYHTYSF